MEFLAPMTISITLFLVIGAVARQLIVNRRMREIARINAELQAKLLDKLTAAGELQAYIASDAGQRFVDAATVERSEPHTKILASVQSGILLFAVGIALQAAHFYVGDEARGVLQLFGLLGMLVGVGFLVSAAAVYTLSQRWGLMPDRQSDQGDPER